MGLLESLLRRPKDAPAGTGFYKTISGNSSQFTQFSGTIYEQELTRACIDRFATACMKLKPEITGEAKKPIARAIATQPNQYDTWPTFLKKVATRFETDATAYVLPSYARDASTIVGFFSLKANNADILEYHGEPWMRFYLPNGDTTAIELRNVCIMSKYTYISDFFSDPNCISTTMQLLHNQSEAQINAMKNGAKIRFIGSLNGQVREEDMAKKRDRFVADNLTGDNADGLMLYDATFTDIQQLKPYDYTMDASSVEQVKQQVYTYYGINEKILQNDFDEKVWGAWYEGKVEPFAVQFGEGLTHLCFSQREQKTNRISFSSSRLEYTTIAEKRNTIRDLMDRGVITINQALEMLQLPTIGPEGDIRVIRGEYINATSVSTVLPSEESEDSEEDS